MDVKEIRRKLGMTQRQFADLVGVHQSQISRWERSGKVSPRVEKCLKLLLKVLELKRTIEK